MAESIPGTVPNLDPETLATLQGYLQLMQPSEDERRAARMQAIAAAGFGLAGARKGFEGQALSNAGLLGLQQYQRDVTALQAQRGQNVGQAMQMVQLAKQLQAQRAQQEALKNWSTMFGGGQMQAGPPQGFQIPGGATALTSAAATGTAPSANALPTQVPSGGMPDRMTAAKANVMGVLAGLPNMSSALEFAYPNPVSMRSGAFGVNPATGQATFYPQAQPGHTLIPDPSAPGGFREVEVPGGLPAISAAAGAQAGARTAAEEAAKFPYQIVKTEGPGNRPLSGYAANVYGLPPLPTPAPTQPPAVNLSANTAAPGYSPITPHDLAWLQRDLQGGAPAGGTVSGMSRAEQKAQDVSSAAQTASNTDWITNEYRPAMNAAALAKRANIGLDVLEKNPITKQTGAFTQLKSDVAKILSGTGMAPEKIGEFAANAEIFNRAMFEHNWQLLQQQKGVQTEGDAQRAFKVYMQLTNRPESNQFIIDFTRAQNNLDVKKAQFYGANRSSAQGKGDYAALGDEWNAKQPTLWDDPAMQKWKQYGEGASPETAKKALPPPKVGEVQKGHRYIGGDPSQPSSWQPVP